MDWRCAGVLALIIPVIAQVAEIPFTALKPDATLPVDLERGTLVTADALWVPQRAGRSIIRIDAENNSADRPLPLVDTPCASLIMASENIWVAFCEAGSLGHINQKFGNASPPVPTPIAAPDGTLAVAAKSLWVITDAKGIVSRVDHEAKTPVAEVYVARHPFALAADDEAIWVTSEAGNTLTRINAQTNVIVETIAVGPKPGLVAIGEGAVWTLNRGDGSVSRVDPKSNKVVATIAVGDAVREATMAVGENAVWLSARGLPLVRIDPRTNRVSHRFSGSGGGVVVAGHGSIWVNAAPQTTWRLDPKLVAAMRP
jgi:YVTN family beta-propeller protein